MKVTRRILASSLTAFGAAGGAAAEECSRIRPEQRLADLGIVLPDAPRPAAAYAPYRRVGCMLHLAGLGPAAAGGDPLLGRVGRDLSIEQGYAAARGAGLNVLALLRAACRGTLDRVVQCVRIGVFVASGDDFHDQPLVANGASDLFVEVFGEAGLGARFAVGVNTLPFAVPVEIETAWEVA